MRKKILYKIGAGVFVFFCILSVIGYVVGSNQVIAPKISNENISTTTSKTANKLKIDLNSNKTIINSDVVVQPTSNVNNTKQINVSLKIEDKIFNQSLDENSSVYDLMQKLTSGGLVFVAKEYSGMGYFVSSINNKNNDPKSGYYWTLYVNGKESNLGASSVILKNSDLVEWKYQNESKTF